MAKVMLGESEKWFIIHGIQDDMRNDGRSCEDYRHIEVETGVVSNTHGSSRLRLGSSELLVGVKVELGSPDPKAPNEGLIHFHVDCSPNADPSFQGRGGEDLSANISCILTRIYCNKSSIDLNTLGIIPHKQCWVVHVDVLILECGGNLLDAVSIAVKAALHNTGVPNIQVTDGDEGTQEISLPDDPNDVKFINTVNAPVLVTISKVGSRHVVDASSEEELCCNASLVMGVTKRGRTTGMRKMGGGSLDPESIPEMIETGKNIGRQLHISLDKLLKTEQGMAEDIEKAGYL
uniref:Exosome component 7 n=1 Tax=Ciona intestinalis TaxID=7719 RepID=F6PLY6_CIOIN|nr:exosome complex component RRP42-like [Ciona intestinalis]|eukprot:XP_002127184.1 exosome complex component RRP42-like [Ciona intestinalis]